MWIDRSHGWAYVSRQARYGRLQVKYIRSKQSFVVIWLDEMSRASMSQLRRVDGANDLSSSALSFHKQPEHMGRLPDIHSSRSMLQCPWGRCHQVLYIDSRSGRQRPKAGRSHEGSSRSTATAILRDIIKVTGDGTESDHQPGYAAADDPIGGGGPMLPPNMYGRRALLDDPPSPMRLLRNPLDSFSVCRERKWRPAFLEPGRLTSPATVGSPSQTGLQQSRAGLMTPIRR